MAIVQKSFSGPFWGLVQQRGPWRETPLDRARGQRYQADNTSEARPYQVDASGAPPRPSEFALNKVVTANVYNFGAQVAQVGRMIKPQQQVGRNMQPLVFQIGGVPRVVPEVVVAQPLVVKTQIPNNRASPLSDYGTATGASSGPASASLMSAAGFASPVTPSPVVSKGSVGSSIEANAYYHNLSVGPRSRKGHDSTALQIHIPEAGSNHQELVPDVMKAVSSGKGAERG